MPVDPFAAVSDPEVVSDAFAGLSTFAPRAKATQPVSTQETRALAEEHGFTIDNFPDTPRPFAKKSKPTGPETFAKTMRIRVEDWNRFADFCRRNGNLSQHEGFSALIQRLPARLDHDGE